MKKSFKQWDSGDAVKFTRESHMFKVVQEMYLVLLSDL